VNHAQLAQNDIGQKSKRIMAARIDWLLSPSLAQTQQAHRQSIMAQNAESDIRALVDSFVEQLTQQIRISALESVRDALLDGKAPAAAPARRKPGPKPGRKPGPKPKAAKAKKTAKGGKRGRRTPEEIEADKAAIADYVKANPGCPMADITDALGLESITLRAQVNELLDAGTIRKEGEKRGTRYFPGGGGSRKATKRGKKRATKKKTSRKRAA